MSRLSTMMDAPLPDDKPEIYGLVGVSIFILGDQAISFAEKNCLKPPFDLVYKIIDKLEDCFSGCAFYQAGSAYLSDFLDHLIGDES